MIVACAIVRRKGVYLGGVLWEDLVVTGLIVWIVIIIVVFGVVR